MTDNNQSEIHGQTESQLQNDDQDFVVVDPDNYQKTKKLEMIHDAKQEVLNATKDRFKLVIELGDNFGPEGPELFRRVLARKVSHYGSELLPLIEKGVESGTVNESQLTVQLPGNPEIDILEFVQNNGRITYQGEENWTTEEDSMAVYRQLDRIQQDLGLGLELEPDKGPAEI